jgi:polar amino acid transport system substrate-binding protein
MPAGGKISIDCKIENNYLVIYFKDNGKGISQENIDHIFNPFFSTNNSGEGTGLGLYIAYNEVQKIGGAIQVESEIGSGTMFKMKFPIMEEMC